MKTAVAPMVLQRPPACSSRPGPKPAGSWGSSPRMPPRTLRCSMGRERRQSARLRLYEDPRHAHAGLATLPVFEHELNCTTPRERAGRPRTDAECAKLENAVKIDSRISVELNAASKAPEKRYGLLAIDRHNALSDEVIRVDTRCRKIVFREKWGVFDVDDLLRVAAEAAIVKIERRGILKRRAEGQRNKGYHEPAVANGSAIPKVPVSEVEYPIAQRHECVEIAFVFGAGHATELRAPLHLAVIAASKVAEGQIRREDIDLVGEVVRVEGNAFVTRQDLVVIEERLGREIAWVLSPCHSWCSC